MKELSEISLAEMDGFRIGHAQDSRAGTGCTVILPAEAAVAGVEVRGGAPGTRETDLLKPENLVGKVHGILLTGGSAFGLNAASGVMEYLQKKGKGFQAGDYSVPIVPSAVLFDLTCGSGDIRPNHEMGYKACTEATFKTDLNGNYGAGTGATVGKYGGMDKAMKGGMGQFIYKIGSLKIGAVAAVNCMGDVYSIDTGEVIAGARNEENGLRAKRDKYAFIKLAATSLKGEEIPSSNTILITVFTNATLSKASATMLARVCHDGIARVVRPSHTMLDGDTVFVMSHGTVKADPSLLGALGVEVTSRAIIKAVECAKTAYGIPGCNL